MNNLFSTRFVRNYHNMDSLSPFVIATDSNGKIVFAQPVETNKLEKLQKVFNSLNEGKPAELNLKPFIASTEEQFDEHFNLVLKEVGELASNIPEAMDLLG